MYFFGSKHFDTAESIQKGTGKRLRFFKESQQKDHARTAIARCAKIAKNRRVP